MQTPNTVDMELKMAFAELQKKMMETSKTVKLLDMEMEYQSRVKQKLDITCAEIKTIPESVKLYESFGRLFLHSPYSKVVSRLEEKSRICSEKKQAAEAEQAILEKSLKESENNLRELVQHKKETSAN